MIYSVLGLGKVVREETLERLLALVYVGFSIWKKDGRRRDRLCKDESAWDCMACLKSEKQFNPAEAGQNAAGCSILVATALDLGHHRLPHRAFEAPHGLGRASPFRFISCPCPLHPLGSNLLGTHLVRFHFWPFESITLYTWTISSSSSLGQFIDNLDLTFSKKPLQILLP